MKKITIIAVAFILSACGSKVTLPAAFTESDSQLEIFPDYTEVTIPANIAPLNFNITSRPEKAVVEIIGDKGGKMLAASDNLGSVKFDISDWSKLLQENRGSSLSYRIYTFDGTKWEAHPSFHNYVAQEDINPYLSYRLIEPAYARYSNLGIYQRNLGNFDETVIYENNNDNHCVNCHSYKNGKTDHMIFHVREKYSGTVVVMGDKVYKVNTKVDPMFLACMYPQWHPTKNIIATSINMVGQFFYILDPKRIEVNDTESDLVIYDVDKNEVFYALKTAESLETFPSWSPTGDRLYYSTYNIAEENDNYLTGNKDDVVARNYEKIHYNIWSMPFDTVTYKFGEPRLEVDAASKGKSAVHIRISPDGKWMIFCMSNFGQAIYSKSSDLYLRNMETGEIRRMDIVNSDAVESYHSWSTEGRWFVFSSRRDDSHCGRCYFSYFDKDGHEHKPFQLPQEDPLHGTYFLKSYNVPEFMVEPVKVSYDKFKEVVYNEEAIPATMRQDDEN